MKNNIFLPIFRGKHLYSNEWIFGYFFKKENDNYNNSYIVPIEKIKDNTKDYLIKNQYSGTIISNIVPVKENTVTMYTGAKDIYGNMIFDKDIVLWNEIKGIVQWDNFMHGFWLQNINDNLNQHSIPLSDDIIKELKKIGDIFSNSL